MTSLTDIGLTPEAFRRLARAYRQRWQVGLLACRPDGWVVAGRLPGRSDEAQAACNARALAVSEALRWGEPTFQLTADDRLIWAVPLMRNAVLLGGLVAWVSEPRAVRSGEMDLARAAHELRQLAEEANLTNAALLEQHRLAMGRERSRAEAIHELKALPSYSLRQVYLLEEPALAEAIRHGERGQARDVLNRVLVGIHHCAGDRLSVVKSLYMELLVTVARTAVEAGGAPEELLDSNLGYLGRLSDIEDEEELAHWLRDALEHALDAVQVHRRDTAGRLVEAIRYLQEHCTEDLSRDEVARQAYLSPAHFSRQVKQHFGRTFTELLTGMRVRHATELLLATDKPVSLVALESGFNDQSYFTKVFRRATGTTPREYRRRHET